MGWEKLDDGNTDEFTFLFVTEQVTDRLDEIIGFNTEGWFEHNHRLRNKIKPKNLYQDKYRKDESSLFNLVHKILYFPDNHDEDGERIDEFREWNCLYEYFLSPKQYDDVCEEKFPSYWVTDYRYDEDEMKLIKDPNYRRMNDFLIRIYEEVFQHVEQHEIMDHYGIE
tara:strand:- start:413 stop:916 length:504 start_codon:yes stop_codon:yes gene_type:complete